MIVNNIQVSISFIEFVSLVDISESNKISQK